MHGRKSSGSLPRTRTRSGSTESVQSHRITNRGGYLLSEFLGEDTVYLPEPSEKEFAVVPPGTHLAVCYRVIDLGTQDSTYNGQSKKAHKVLVSWELPDEKMSDGRPFTISQRYTWSMNEKAALRRDLESWRGTPFGKADFGPNGFNIRKIIGKGCLLTVVHQQRGEKTYANISAIGKLMKGMETPKLTNEIAYLWINPELWDSEVFNKLSDGLKQTIQKSPEYHTLTSEPDETEPPPIEADEFHSAAIPF